MLILAQYRYQVCTYMQSNRIHTHVHNVKGEYTIVIGPKILVLPQFFDRFQYRNSKIKIYLERKPVIPIKQCLGKQREKRAFRAQILYCLGSMDLHSCTVKKCSCHKSSPIIEDKFIFDKLPSTRDRQLCKYRYTCHTHTQVQAP